MQSLKKLPSEFVEVPYDRINAEIMARPEMLKRFSASQLPLKEGDNVPLFWIDDGIDRLGATMGSWGALTWSTREHRTVNSLTPWGAIFGERFLREFEEEKVGRVMQDFWVDRKEKFWQRTGPHQFSPRSLENLRMRLRVNYGLDDSRDKKSMSSEVERAILSIQDAKEVTGVGYFPYNHNEVVVLQGGKKFLNCATVRPCDPAPEGEGLVEKFPWVAEFLGIGEGSQGLWDEAVDANGISQRDYFLAWLKHFYVGAYNGAPTMGQVVFLAGPPDIGKSFLNAKILPFIAGGREDASQFLLGQTNFNEALSTVGYWVINDADFNSDNAMRARFTARIKEFAANPYLRVEAKGKEAFTAECSARLMITCNPTESGHSILPSIDEAMADKVMFLSCRNDGWRPHYHSERLKNEARMEREVPYFLRWLLDWQPPKSILTPRSRFGVAAFLHEHMLYQSQKNDGVTGFLSDLDDLRKSDPVMFEDGKKDYALVTAGALVQMLYDFRSTARYTAVGAGRFLNTAVRMKVPWLKKIKRPGAVTFYKVAKPPKTGSLDEVHLGDEYGDTENTEDLNMEGQSPQE
jgi:hypothetical protein